MNENYRQAEIDKSAKTLANIGVQMHELDGSYRPFNEVMMDLGKAIKQLREIDDQKQFEIMRSYIYTSLVGARNYIEFMF